ncbi:MAG: DNA repair exonuclease [Armatimonadota bacterium]|nr:DNA repair exonuclease [Armatimonadota bacterium]
MRFVQFADCHVDSSGGGTLALSSEKKAVLREDIRRSLAAACQLVISVKADLVLIPGDLFDFESITAESVSFIADQFAGLAPRPVLIAPGNHDSLRAGSPYLPTSGVNWPGNVRIFTSQTFESIGLPELNCSVTGIAHAHRGITQRLLTDSIPRAEADISILLFHGSREGFRPSDKENVIPFSDVELARQGFTYTAVGHYHSYACIKDQTGRTLGAYSGCIQGRGLDETGEKVAIVGNIDSTGQVTLDTVEVCQRRIVSVEVNITGAGSRDSILERTAKSLEACGARPQDIVIIDLCGASSRETDTTAIESEFSGKYFHVRVSTARLVPDYDAEVALAESAAASVRSAFLRRMLELKKTAATREELAVVEDAIYYGLCALDGRPVEARDVD